MFKNQYFILLSEIKSLRSTTVYRVSAHTSLKQYSSQNNTAHVNEIMLGVREKKMFSNESVNLIRLFSNWIVHCRTKQ